MFCKDCGEKIPNGSKFCNICGASQAPTASVRSATRVEVCALEVCGKKTGIAGVFGGLLFGDRYWDVWYEACIGSTVIATGPVVGGVVGTGPSSPGNKDAHLALVNQLQADGWEPIVDSRTGYVTSMKRSR